MLQFIFGRAASGKTSLVLEKIRKNVTDGKKAVLLVPEQFSFESEKAVLEKLGDHDASAVSVMSFSRFCDEAERETGGMCGITLSAADKLVLMNRALRSSADELKLWGRYIRSVGFASALLNGIEEFKLNAVTPQELRKASESAQTPSLAAKLSDTATIFSCYNSLVGERFIDPSDRLTKLYDKLQSYHWFAGKTVYLDSFKGFTGQQFKIIDRILAQAQDVFVSLTGDTKNFREYDVFTNVRKTADRIRRIAAAHHVRCEADKVLHSCYYTAKSLSAVERLLSTGTAEKCDPDGGVTICRAATVYDEAEFAARTIRRLVHEDKNSRYRDFVIIARDTAPYEDAVAAACAKNDVSCFLDKRIPLSAFPPVAAALSAIGMVQSLSTEQILRFHKSGLGTLTGEEISLLENYTYLWNLDGAVWNEQWDMNPNGLVAVSEQDEDRSATVSKQINELRQKAITPINLFRKEFHGTAAQMSAAIVRLFEICHADKSFRHIAEIFANDGKQSNADALRQSWDAFMKLLDSLSRCFGEGDIANDEFADALKTAVSLTTIGVTPQMLDEVTFGAADRIRPSRPKVAFILGANQGIFPKAFASGGLFGPAEREKLNGLGIEIPDRTVGSAIDEDFLVYTNLCCATDRLFISYCASGADGKDCEPSSFVGAVTAKIPCLCVTEPDKLGNTNLPQTAAAAFSDFCTRLSAAPGEAAVMKEVLSGKEEFSGRIAAAESCRTAQPQRLSRETAVKLFGRELSMSASKFDDFHRCKFQYFCKHGLRARRLQPADFDVLQRGTLIHYVLQQLIESYGKGISQLDEPALGAAVDRFINEYLDSIRGYRSIENAHLRFLLSNISRSVKEVALQIAHEFAQSEFEPCGCEVKFSRDGENPPLKIPFDGGDVVLSGSVDRVDCWNGYVRIIDYKSGHRDFKLPDILFGQNLQMLIYLYTLTRLERFSSDRPAGIFYMPSKRDRNGGGLAMNGLMVSDETLVHAMEKENRGEFVPKYKLTQKGTLDHNCAASFIDQNGFERIFAHIDRLMRQTGYEILNGNIDVDPVDGRDSKACKYCDFSAVCGIGDRKCRRVPALSNDEVINELVKEETDDGISGDSGAKSGD